MKTYLEINQEQRKNKRYNSTKKKKKKNCSNSIDGVVFVIQFCKKRVRNILKVNNIKKIGIFTVYNRVMIKIALYVSLIYKI